MANRVYEGRESLASDAMPVCMRGMIGMKLYCPADTFNGDLYTDTAPETRLCASTSQAAALTDITTRTDLGSEGRKREKRAGVITPRRYDTLAWLERLGGSMLMQLAISSRRGCRRLREKRVTRKETRHDWAVKTEGHVSTLPYQRSRWWLKSHLLPRFKIWKYIPN